MNHTLNQVDQEEKKERGAAPGKHWTAVQYLERLETQFRLWRKRRALARKPEPERPAHASGERRADGSRSRAAKQVYGGEPQTAPAQAAVRRSRPAVTDFSSLKQAVLVEAAHIRRRCRHIFKEAKARRFPESNRRPVQLVLMLGGLLPMIGSHFRERVRSRHQRSVRRSNGVGAWLERHKLRPAVFFSVAAIVVVTALFSSFYTVATTVTYDGEVIGSVASERTAKAACKDLEKVTKEALGGSYTLSDSLVQYSTSIMPRSQLVDGETFEEELSDSIAQYGVLNPLTVRLRDNKYELVAGERRLRAARLAGLYDVPCILLDVSLEDASLIALVENLQRRDLDFLEEANGLSQLIKLFGMSQEEAARRIGKSQSAVANKLRLLKLPEDILHTLCDNGLTERHGRALLRLPTAEAQRLALAYIIDRDLNVAATASYIDSLLDASEQEKREPKRTFIMKDVRVFVNTILHGLDLMQQGGIQAGMHREETDEELILTIKIPKNREQPPEAAPGNACPL